MCQALPAMCFQAFQDVPMDLDFIENIMISMTITNARLTEMVLITMTALYLSPISLFKRLESKARAVGIYPRTWQWAILLIAKMYMATGNQNNIGRVFYVKDVSQGELKSNFVVLSCFMFFLIVYYLQSKP